MIATAVSPSRRSTALSAALILLSMIFAHPAAGASQQGLFLDSVAAAYAHYRGAYSYLRTGNAALAALELEQARDKWRSVMEAFGGTPPDGFSDDPKWRETLTTIGAALGEALGQTDAGDLEGARQTLQPVRGALAELRRRNGVTTFSDRIDEISAAMERLWRHRHDPPDLTSPESARALASRAAVLAYLLERAREAAPPKLASDDAFQRLIAGALEGCDRLWQALDRKDEALLVNTLRELRSFEQILFLRFG